ncbi:MAG: hypothetical protein AAFX99_01650 [Myxococcota bacterium]
MKLVTTIAVPSLVLLMFAGCIDDLDFDAIEPSCEPPRFDLPTRDTYCSGELTTSVVAAPVTDHYVAVAALGSKAFVLEGTPLDRTRCTASTPENNCDLTYPFNDTNTPLYEEIRGWIVDLDQLGQDVLDAATAKAVVSRDTPTLADTVPTGSPVGTISRVTPLSTLGGAMLVETTFRGLLLVQLDGQEGTIPTRRLELEFRVPQFDVLANAEINPQDIQNIEVWQPDTNRMVVMLSVGGVLKTLAFAWDGTNWLEEEVPNVEPYLTFANNAEDFDQGDFFAFNCCLVECVFDSTATTEAELLGQVNRCRRHEPRNSPGVCFARSDVWPHLTACINQIFVHQPSFSTTSIALSATRPQLYVGGTTLEPQAQNTFLLRGSIGVVNVEELDPANTSSTQLDLSYTPQNLPPVEGIDSNQDTLSVSSIAVDANALYVFSSVLSQSIMSTDENEDEDTALRVLQQGDSRFTLHIFTLDEEGQIDPNSVVRSKLITEADGNSTTLFDPHIEWMGDGVLAIRLNRIEFIFDGDDTGTVNHGTITTIWELSGSGPIPDAPLRRYEDNYDEASDPRSHMGLIARPVDTDSSLLIYPTQMGLERIDLTLGGAPLP